MLIITSIIFVMDIAIMFSLLGYTILILRICKKRFLSIIFCIIKVYSWSKTNVDTCNNLYSFCYGHYNHILLIGIHDIDALDLQKKLFFSIILLTIKAYPWIEANMDTCNNLYSFSYWALHSCSLHWDTRYWCLDLQEKFFFLPLSL